MGALVAVGLVALLWLPAVVGAQTTRREGGGDAAARLQQQLRRLQAEKSELQTQNADLVRQLDETKQRLKGLEGVNRENEAALARYEEALAQFKARLEESFERIRQTDAQLLDLSELQRQTTASLAQTEARRDQLSADLATRTSELADCEDKNLKLYEANVNMAERFEKKGFWDTLMQAEPFTGLKQVEVENILQEYRFRLEDLRRKGPEGVGAASATGLTSD